MYCIYVFSIVEKLLISFKLHCDVCDTVGPLQLSLTTPTPSIDIMPSSNVINPPISTTVAAHVTSPDTPVLISTGHMSASPSTTAVELESSPSSTSVPPSLQTMTMPSSTILLSMSVSDNLQQITASPSITVQSDSGIGGASESLQAPMSMPTSIELSSNSFTSGAQGASSTAVAISLSSVITQSLDSVGPTQPISSMGQSYSASMGSSHSLVLVTLSPSSSISQSSIILSTMSSTRRSYSSMERSNTLSFVTLSPSPSRSAGLSIESTGIPANSIEGEVASSNEMQITPSSLEGLMSTVSATQTSSIASTGIIPASSTEDEVVFSSNEMQSTPSSSEELMSTVSATQISSIRGSALSSIIMVNSVTLTTTDQQSSMSTVVQNMDSSVITPTNAPVSTHTMTMSTERSRTTVEVKASASSAFNIPIVGGAVGGALFLLLILLAVVLTAVVIKRRSRMSQWNIGSRNKSPINNPLYQDRKELIMQIVLLLSPIIFCMIAYNVANFLCHT